MALTEGVAMRSRFHPDPPLHILQRLGSDYALWCSGTPARLENTVNRLRCPQCTVLLREGVAEGMYSAEELDDWLRSTRASRTFGVGRGRG